MALLESVLASWLEVALDPKGEIVGDITAADQPTRIAQAFGAYFKAATPPVIAMAIDDDAVPAMADALDLPPGATPAEGAAALTAGYAAFWAEMVSAPATFFASATVVAPPAIGLAALPGAFVTQFGANLNPGITTAQAAANLAAAIHANAGVGGFVTFASPPPVSIA